MDPILLEEINGHIDAKIAEIQNSMDTAKMIAEKAKAAAESAAIYGGFGEPPYKTSPPTTSFTYSVRNDSTPHVVYEANNVVFLGPPQNSMWLYNDCKLSLGFYDNYPIKYIITLNERKLTYTDRQSAVYLVPLQIYKKVRVEVMITGNGLNSCNVNLGINSYIITE